MKKYDVIIIGGSYAGLSAAMALGRSLRKTVIIDSQLRCNNSAPEAHNFLTRDGQNPGEIHAAALNEVKLYPTIDYHNGYVIEACKAGVEFHVNTWSGASFTAPILVFATGLKDILPEIPGLEKCWGVSVLHCPYCHGYEIKNKKTGILINDPTELEFVNLINHWTKDLILFTNGTFYLPEETISNLNESRVKIVDTPINRLIHTEGRIKKVQLADNTTIEMEAMYVKSKTKQNCHIPETLGCNLTDEGLITVNEFQKTNVPGIFSCGDSSNLWRSISLSVSSGSKAGMFVNQELLENGF